MEQKTATVGPTTLDTLFHLMEQRFGEVLTLCTRNDKRQVEDLESVLRKLDDLARQLRESQEINCMYFDAALSLARNGAPGPQ